MMKRRIIMSWLPVTVLALSPAVVYADAGTPLIWGSAFHLLLGNALIGGAEGLVLMRLFRQKRAGYVPIMIAANYFSTWAGGVFLAHAIVAKLDLDLLNAWRWVWCMVAITFFLTLLLEWPFVAFCLRRCNGWLSRSIWGSLIVQSASYVVLLGWYWVMSQTSLYTESVIVQPSAFSFPRGTILYYIAESDGNVYARDLSRGETRKICGLKSSERSGTLLLRESRSVASRWDLVVAAGDQDTSPTDRIVSAGLTCAVPEPPTAGIRPGGEVPRFRADKSGWTFHFGWMAGGLYGTHETEGRRFDVSLETPFVRWPVHCPAQLPCGEVVFQLSENQICVVDPNEKKIALLVKGRWPVITMGGTVE